MKKFLSNTYVGTGNNHILRFPEKRVIEGRMSCPVIMHGTYNYKFTMQNKVDTMFEGGTYSYPDLEGEPYRILSAFAGCGTDLTPITFGQETSAVVGKGESLTSDPITLTVPEGALLDIYITVEGTDMPYTLNKVFPAFIKYGDAWVYSAAFPQPVRIDCDAPFTKSVVFLGDSITQGVGSTKDRFCFWVAEIAKRLPKDISIYNLGLGCARVSDAAKDGVWLSRAKSADTVIICLGTNDIGQMVKAEPVCENTAKTIELLREAGVNKIGLIEMPPFNWDEEQNIEWRKVRKFTQEELFPKVEYKLISAEAWGNPAPNENICRYGGHPDDEGALAMVELFFKHIDLAETNGDML